MRIDAHQHFWRLERGDYGWLTPDLPIHRDYGPEDLHPLLDMAEIDGTVLVQAAPTEAETAFMLDLAQATPWIRGVVGWTDFASHGAPARIAEMAAHPFLVGLRPMIQDIPDDDWMLRPTVGAGLRAMAETGLVFDALTLPRHLPNLRRLLADHPDLKVVIDHASKAPVTADGPPPGWRADMAALASETDAFCKLSGIVTEAAAGWDVEMLRPYVTHLLDSFGPNRLVWGSDWPVLTMAASYADWDAATQELLSGLTEPDRAAVLGGNAIRLYGLDRG